MLNWFKKSSPDNFLTVDIHSHLLPGLDDGVQSLDESLAIIRKLKSLGFKKIITTPHVITDYYPNTPQIILTALEALEKALVENKIDIKIEAAAEYFVDEYFLDQINSGQELLTFGDKYLLMETGFINKPLFLEDVIFSLASRGFKPVLAHPERYHYLQEDYALAAGLKDKGLLFQTNVMSLHGYYSSESKELSAHLIHHGMVDFLGSDIHNLRHLDRYINTMDKKLFQKCRQLPLLNNALF